MDKVLLQSLTFGVLFSLVMTLLECRILAAKHGDFFGVKEAFIPQCHNTKDHIFTLASNSVFFFILGFVFYCDFWFKVLPLW